MHPFTLTFLFALAAQVAVTIWLGRRQIAFVDRHRAVPPVGFESAVTPEEHSRAADYAIARQHLSLTEAVYDAAVVLWLTVGGGIALFGELALATGVGAVATGTVHLLVVFAVLSLLALPFAVYRTFVLEQRFGFNRTRPATFVADRLKAWAVGLLLGSPLAAGVLWIMAAAGAAWWLVAWAGWLAFSLLLTWAWPRLIAPLFNRFSPLDDVSLRSRIDALLTRCGFRARSVYVMDGSRRSSHGNAYFTGLGREKRIVFFDTLLTSLDSAQIESVLAHELAHFKLRHVPQRLLVGALSSLAGFALLGWLSRRDWFYTALGVPQPGDATALLLFLLVLPAFTWIASPFFAAWSRRHEYQADAFAARYSDAHALAGALVTLYKDNATTLTPDPLYSAFHDSHPPPAARIARLRELGGAVASAS